MIPELKEIRELEEELGFEKFKFSEHAPTFSLQLVKRLISLKYIKDLRKDFEKQKQIKNAFSLAWLDKWVNRLTNEYFIENEDDDESEVNMILNIKVQNDDYIRMEDINGGISFTNQ